MRFLSCLLLLACLCTSAFGVAAVTTTIDLTASTATLGTNPGSFATTAQTDHVIIKGGSIARTLVFQCTVAWDYIDPVSTKVIHLVAGQTLKLPYNPNVNVTFDTTRVGADGVVTAMIVK